MNTGANDPYLELLDAAIRHLEDLRDNGRKWVPASHEKLRTLIAARAEEPVVACKTGAPAVSISSPQPSASVTAPPAAAKVPPGLLFAPSPTPADPAGKCAAIESLRQPVLACRKCAHLAQSRRNVVFGVGNPAARLMFVGEAPGADEDEQGEPFVGKAGQLLTKIIQTMGLKREEVYIANILKCRPDTPGQVIGNRKPTPSEMATCLPYLLEQIKIIGPEVIVALGGTAVEGLFGRGDGITKMRGKWLEFMGVPVMPTYHPAYLLRNQSMREKRKVWEDMLQVMERLGLPITEKHRSYFLRA